MKRILCVLLVAIMAFGSLVSCGSSLKEGEKGAIIEMYISTLPDSFDPAIYQTDADVTKLLSLMYMPLTVMKTDGSLGKGLAKEWGGYYDEIYNEYKMYFTLYNTGWSDDRAVSADDFVYAWKRILSPDFDSPYASMLFPIKNAKAVKQGVMTSDDLGIAAADDTRLEVTFESEYDINLFAETVSNIAFAPLREDKISLSDWSYKIVIANIPSCGQFTLRSYNNNDGQQHSVELERNVNFRRDVEEDPLDEYVLPYKIICNYANEEDLKAASAAYDAGKVHYLAEFNPETYAKYQNDVKSYDALASYTCYFNTSVEALSQAEVRKALSIALDRNEIAKLASCGAVAATGFVPQGVFATNKGTSFRKDADKEKPVYNASADVNAAKQLLSKAGVSGDSITLTYINDLENGANTKIAEYIAKVWGDLGFYVELEAIDWPVAADPESGENDTAFDIRELLANKEGNSFEVLLMDLSVGATNPLAYLAPFAINGGGLIYEGEKLSEQDNDDLHMTQFNNKEYSELVYKAINTSDRKVVFDYCKQLETMLAEQCPATALVFYKNSYVSSSKISGVGSLYNGAPSLAKVELKGWRESNLSYGEQ